MKNVLKMILAMVACFAFGATAVWASQAAGDQGGSLLLMLFIGFFALIIVFQLVPACLLFIGILKGLFARERKGQQKGSRI